MGPLRALVVVCSLLANNKCSTVCVYTLKNLWNKPEYLEIKEKNTLVK